MKLLSVLLVQVVVQTLAETTVFHNVLTQLEKEDTWKEAVNIIALKIAGKSYSSQLANLTTGVITVFH